MKKTMTVNEVYTTIRSIEIDCTCSGGINTNKFYYEILGMMELLKEIIDNNQDEK